MNTNAILRGTGLLLALGLTISGCDGSDPGRDPFDSVGDSGGASDTDEDPNDAAGDGSAWDDGAVDDGAVDDGTDDDGPGGPTPVCGDGVTDSGEHCDDANPYELDGCRNDCRFGPTGLQVDTSVDPDILVANGGGGGSHFQNDCSAEDEVIIGIAGRAGKYVDQLQAQCGTMQLTVSEAGSIEVNLEPSKMTESQGGGGGGEFSLGCEPGEAVIGIKGRAGKYLDQLSLRCAPLVLVEDPETGLTTVELGQMVSTDHVGGGGGSEFISDCLDGAVATIAHGRSGSHIDAFGLGCRALEAF